MVAQELSRQYPHCVHNREVMAALARNFKGNATVVSAMEARASRQDRDDAFALVGIIHVAPTPLLKSMLLKCLEGPQSLSSWAASALIDVWGAD